MSARMGTNGDPRMSKGTTRRSIRIDDGLWDKAQDVASEKGDHLSDIIREAIRQYIQENEES